MKTHFYPYPTEDGEVEQAPCGTWLGEASGLSADWGVIDCRRCIARKSKMVGAHDTEEKAIVQQMGDMADFMRSAQGESA